MDDLTRKKLLLEIQRLQIPWYKNIEFWKVTIPTVAILASLYFTFGKGALDFEKNKLEIQKEQLKLEISQFEIKRNLLEDTIFAKDQHRSALQKSIEEYSFTKDSLNNEIKHLMSDKQVLIKQRSSAITDRMKDKDFYLEEIARTYSQSKSFEKDLNYLKRKISAVEVENAKLRARDSFYSSKYKLTRQEELHMDMLASEAGIDRLKRDDLELKKSVERIRERYAKEKERIKNMSPDQLVREYELLIRRLRVEQQDE